MREQQEIPGRFQRLSMGQKDLNEILFNIQNITGQYRKFYRNQAIERKKFYSETSPQLEEYARQIDNIVSTILPPAALVKNQRSHHTRVFIGDRSDLRAKLNANRAMRRQNQHPYFGNRR